MQGFNFSVKIKFSNNIIALVIKSILTVFRYYYFKIT